VFTDATRPLGISSEGISVPIQNPFNPFTVPDYTSRIDPNILRLRLALHPRGPDSRPVCIRGFGSRVGYRQDYHQQFGVYRRPER
jgi:hypothetical protein